jgi:nucleoside-diphosphate-sugar epimerase
MEILITGAGMVGSHAAARLAAAGHAVTLFDVAPDESYVRGVAGPAPAIVRGDIRDLPSLAGAVRAARTEVVVHTAALIGNAAQADPYRGFAVNVIGTLNVLEAARLLGVRRLVHASTLGTNDLAHPQPAPLTEDFPLGSNGRVYGASKCAAEQILRAGCRAYDLELVMLRFAGIYGYGRFAGGSGIGREVDTWLRAALAGREAVSGGGMPGAYELVHVKDVASAVLLAAEAAALPHDTYNVGSGVLTTPAELEGTIAHRWPGFRVAAGAPLRADPHPRRHPFDLTRSRAELGYRPQLTLEAGLDDLAAEITAEGSPPR